MSIRQNVLCNTNAHSSLPFGMKAREKAFLKNDIELSVVSKKYLVKD
jgi:hypothetical protein